MPNTEKKSLEQPKMVEDQLEFSFEEVDQAIAEQVEKTLVETEKMTEIDWQTIRDLTADLSPTESAQIENTATNARNELLGEVSDVADEFYKKQQEIIKKWEDSDSENYAGNEHQEKMAWHNVYSELTDEGIKQRVDAKRKAWAELDGIDGDYTDSEQFSLQTGEALKQVIEEKNREIEKKSNEKLSSEVSKEASILNPEVVVDDLDTNVEKKPESQVESESVPKVEKNIGRIGRLTTEAKRIWDDLNFKRRGKSEINKSQRLLEKSEDKLHKLEADKLKSEDKIDRLKDRLSEIEKLLAKTSGGMKPKELQVIEKSQQDLAENIKKEQGVKTLLEQELADEKANKSKLETGVKTTLFELNKALEKKLEPYQAELDKLESNRELLLEDKAAYVEEVAGFNDKLNDLRVQVAGLAETDMPGKAKRLFKSVLNRKIKELEAQLKISQKNITKLDNENFKINGRMSKEEATIGKWLGIKIELDGEAKNRPAKERVPFRRSYVPRERSDANPEFEPGVKITAMDYMDKWNTFSKSDGMLLNKKEILTRDPEISINKLESIITNTRFKGLSERQLKKKIKEKKDLVRVSLGLY